MNCKEPEMSKCLASKIKNLNYDGIWKVVYVEPRVEKDI